MKPVLAMGVVAVCLSATVYGQTSRGVPPGYGYVVVPTNVPLNSLIVQSTVETATNAVTVTGSQSNTIAAALTNPAAFATAAQGSNAVTALSLANALATTQIVVVAAVNSNSTPYQPWSATLTPPASAGTTLVSYAMGTAPLLVCTGAQTIGVDPNGGWGVAGINRASLTFYPSNFSITIQSNAYTTWQTPITITANKTNSILFRATATNDWRLYQLQ